MIRLMVEFILIGLLMLGVLILMLLNGRQRQTTIVTLACFGLLGLLWWLLGGPAHPACT